MTAQSTINCVSFNQTGSCLTIGTSQGYGLYNCSPFGKFHSELAANNASSDTTGGYSIVEMLFSTSLVALVGNGASPQLSPRTLRLINTRRGTVVCEISFPTPVLSVQMNRGRLVVLLALQVYVYDLPTLSLLRVIDRAPTRSHQVCVSAGSGRNLLVYPSPSQTIASELRPGLTTNNVNLLHNKLSDPLSEDMEVDAGDSDSDLEDNIAASDVAAPVSSSVHAHPRTKHGDVIVFDLDALEPTLVVEAHENAIAAIALSADGSLLATASERGTIVRVFSTVTGLKLYQFRRGTYKAQIESMSFSEDGLFLCVCASRQTVHVFKLGSVGDTPLPDNHSAASVESGLQDSGDGNVASAQPYVDSARATVGRLIRNSSQNLTRRAAETLGQIFPKGVSALLDPARHFASIKLPGAPAEENTGDTDTSGVRATAAIGGTLLVRRSDYPELFPQLTEDNETSADPAADTLSMLEVRVATTQGQLYRYVMDPERGGDCVLLTQYPLLSSS